MAPRPRRPILSVVALLFLFLVARCDSQVGGCSFEDVTIARAIPINLAKNAPNSTSDYPFLVNVMSPRTATHVCSGTLVGPDLVLTAASCVAPSSPNAEPFPVVRLGTYALDGQGAQMPFEERRTVEQRIHKSFNGDPKAGFDVAILKLEAGGETYAPLGAFKDLRRSGEDEEAFTLGWFKASSIGAPSQTLQMITNLTHVPDEECRKVFDTLPRGTICAMPTLRAHCEWDLGAPLLMCNKKTNTTMLAGYASFSSPTCGQKNMPYVYVDLGGELLAWVEELGLKNSDIKTRHDEL